MLTLPNIVQIVRVHGALFFLEGREVRRDALTVFLSFFVLMFAAFGMWLTLNAAIVWLLWGQPAAILLTCGALNTAVAIYACVRCVAVLRKERFGATRREVAQTLASVLEML